MQEAEEWRKIKRRGKERLLRQQSKIEKWEVRKPKPPKVIDLLIRSFDGESVVLGDGRVIKRFAEDTMKEELHATMVSLNEDVGERAVCHISTDLDFVPPTYADSGVDWASTLIEHRVYRVNYLQLEIIEARGIRNYP